MQVLAHPDPFVLEHELLERVDRERAADRLRPVLILVPTSRLRDHVRRRLAERLGAVLGIHVEHYHAFSLRVLESNGERVPPVLSRALQLSLVEQSLRRVGGTLAAFVERRPGALSAVRRTINDLREAGLSPDDVSGALGRDGAERGVAELYAAYCGALDEGADRFVDRAGLVLRALPHVEPHVRERNVRLALHHGAYELLGVHVELLRAVDRAAALSVLIGAEPGAAATVFAERFARRWLLEPGDDLVRLDDGPGGLLGTRLAGLYDEEATPEPTAEGTVGFRNAQGTDAELTFAARRALNLVREGTPPERIAIVARTLRPYLPRAEATALESGAPWAIGGAVPLRRHPAVHDLLLLLTIVREDFPRAATVELLRSPRVRWRALDTPRPLGDQAEDWSRRARLLGGLTAWTEELPRWAAEADTHTYGDEEERRQREERRRRRIERVEQLGRALQRARDEVDPADRPWSDHADRVGAIVRTWLPGIRSGTDPEPEIEALLELLGDMGAVETLAGDRRRVSFEEMTLWLERAVDEGEVPLTRRDIGGIRVLDALQARGSTFDHVFLLGMNEGLFPKATREDAFLGDEARGRLSASTGRPLTRSDEGDDQERLLLAMTLGAARVGLEVSWQRADDAGLTRAPSMALREAARVAVGRPDLAGLLARAEALPAHPQRWLETLAHDPGCLTRDEESILLALRSRRPAVAREAIAAREPGLEPGLAMLCSTESFAPSDMRYDGRVGDAAPAPDGLGVSALETLGRCPLQFFFRHVLKVRPLDDETRPFEVEPREQGTLAHEVLEALYRRLVDEGLFATGDGEVLVERAVALLPSVWEETMRPLASRMGPRLPELWQYLEQRWLKLLGEFVKSDLRRISEAGLSVEHLEMFRDEELELGENVTLRLRGRLDRMLRCADGTGWIGDYKTGRVDKRADVTRMLKGEELQVPLYWMLAGKPERVEVLGVGPRHDPELVEPEDRYELFKGFDKPQHQAGFLETMRVMLALVQRGTYPLRRDDHCRWCDYRLACRQQHHPTREREAVAPDGADYRDLHRKNKSGQPTLEQVRASGRRRR